MNYQSIYQTEVQKRLKSITGSQILIPEDIRHLPELIQKYLRYVGAVGKPKIQNVRVVFNGSMKRNQKSNWMPIASQQYNFMDEPSRFFYIRAKMSGIQFDGETVWHTPDVGEFCYGKFDLKEIAYNCDSFQHN